MQKHKKRGFIFLKLLFYTVILGFIILSIFQYKSLRDNAYLGLEDTISVLKVGIEDRLRATDKLYYAFELAVEEELNQSIQIMVDAHLNGTLTESLLEQIKNDNPYLDLYVINENSQIIMATHQEDVGLDFSVYPQFSKYLDDIRNSDAYISERITVATLSSDIKKYAYHGVKDTGYILEASYDMSAFDEIMGTDSYEEFSSTSVQENDFILEMEIYNHTGETFDGKKSIYDHNELERIDSFDEAIFSRSPVKFSQDVSNYEIITEFIPFQMNDFKYVSTRLVLELTYTDRYIVKNNNQWILRQSIILFILLSTFIFIHFYYNRNWLKPLHHLLDALDDLADNELDTRLEVSGSSEMEAASSAFNDMADSIETLIADKEEHEAHLTDLLSKIEKGYFETVLALANAIDVKDNYTSTHSERVMSMSVLLGRHINLPKQDLTTLMYGSLLHDVGKIGIVDRILNKEGRFTDEEYRIIKTHPKIGYDITKDIEFLKQASSIILSHHEKIDGTGYPNQLKGDDIPLMAKIVSITDAFEAMTSKRVYRDYEKTVEEAFNELKACSGNQFDTYLVEQFIEAYTKRYGNKLDTYAKFIEKDNPDLPI